LFGHLNSVDATAYDQLSAFANRLAKTRKVTNPLPPPKARIIAQPRGGKGTGGL
jgi:hypothetical protein